MVPSVRRQNRSDGGYFVTFKNDRIVNNPLFCVDHGEWSPYIFIKRISTKSTKAAMPVFKNILFLSSAGNSNNLPAANPTSMMPSQGTGGKTMKKKRPEKT